MMGLLVCLPRAASTTNNFLTFTSETAPMDGLTTQQQRQLQLAIGLTLGLPSVYMASAGSIQLEVATVTGSERAQPLRARGLQPGSGAAWRTLVSVKLLPGSGIPSNEQFGVLMREDAFAVQLASHLARQGFAPPGAGMRVGTTDSLAQPLTLMVPLGACVVMFCRCIVM